MDKERCEVGWSELRRIPNEYNETVAEIDEKLIELAAKRWALTGRRRFYPPDETVAAWAERHELEESQIRLFLNSLQVREPLFPHLLGPLQGVVPIMKRTVTDGCEYTMTHLMQYENVSQIFIEIEYLEEDRHEVQVLRANLMLEIIGGEQPYQVQRHGNNGGGPRTQMQFLVSPPLPDGLEQIEFSLVPSAISFETKRRELVLDKQIDFE